MQDYLLQNYLLKEKNITQLRWPPRILTSSITSVPSSNVPPLIETVHPSSSVTYKVYWVVAGGSDSGVWTIHVGGVDSSSSVEQL